MSCLLSVLTVFGEVGLGPALQSGALPGDRVFPVRMLIILGNYESLKRSHEHWG